MNQTNQLIVELLKRIRTPQQALVVWMAVGVVLLTAVYFRHL